MAGLLSAESALFGSSFCQNLRPRKPVCGDLTGSLGVDPGAGTFVNAGGALSLSRLLLLAQPLNFIALLNLDDELVDFADVGCSSS